MEINDKATGDYEGIIHALPDGVLVIDDGGLIVFHNEKAREYLRVGTVDLIGRPFGYITSLEGATEIELHPPNQPSHTYEIRSAEIPWRGKKSPEFIILVS